MVSFDILDDNARSREIIRATVEFMRTELTRGAETGRQICIELLDGYRL